MSLLKLSPQTIDCGSSFDTLLDTRYAIITRYPAFEIQPDTRLSIPSLRTMKRLGLCGYN